MLKERLPVRIDPFRLAQARRFLGGRVSVTELKRLGACLADESGEVDVEMEFGIDADGISFLRGHLRAELKLTCQRCLEMMPYPIDTEFLLGIVTSEAEAQQLPSHYEPLVVGGEPLFANDVVEDELILALPAVSRHELSDCPAADVLREVEEGGRERQNPFSVLSELKTGQKKDDT